MPHRIDPSFSEFITNVIEELNDIEIVKAISFWRKIIKISKNSIKDLNLKKTDNILQTIIIDIETVLILVLPHTTIFHIVLLGNG
jgi:hypothetical protein